ncbi:flagellar hook-basal body complex protein FliE [Hyphococcus luteus]|uniref:Flagellar hook-basal body complex protein FliE n=1 Tax=Hyphococcus luteus TaxID=2058213 RepID=A0A2S7K8T4_9PROT|nr:flagellar hook-basal body complex protein FliE [Marinicaulis flavus]PQA88869.1 flagellar hook-basal body protein FliE [Marinicaulis flavus]
MKLPAFHAAQSYNLAKSALKTEGSPGKAGDASPSVKGLEENPAFKAVHEVASSVAEGEKAAMNYMTGSADPHSVVEALAKAELAVQTAVTVRDKVVEAYQELIRMPI